MSRLYAVLIAGSLALAGCKGGSPPAFPDLAGLEQDAVRVNNALAASLTVASALHDEARVQAAAAGMARCPAGDAACKAAAGEKAKADAASRGETLKGAVGAQHRLADALAQRAACREAGDVACVARLAGEVAKLLPQVERLVEGAKGMASP